MHPLAIQFIKLLAFGVPWSVAQPSHYYSFLGVERAHKEPLRNASCGCFGFLWWILDRRTISNARPDRSTHSHPSTDIAWYLHPNPITQICGDPDPIDRLPASHTYARISRRQARASKSKCHVTAPAAAAASWGGPACCCHCCSCPSSDPSAAPAMPVHSSPHQRPPIGCHLPAPAPG